MLRSVAHIGATADGSVNVAPFATMSQSERFLWPTTQRRTLVQPAPRHAGVIDDPAATLEHPYRLLVVR